MIHYQMAAKKLAFEDRIRYLEDPAFGDPKIALLISKEYAAKRRQFADEILRRPAIAVANQSSDTTYLCAADRDGNAISFIQSVFAPFGSPRDRRRHRRDHEQPAMQFRSRSEQSQFAQARQTAGAYVEHLHGLSRQRSLCRGRQPGADEQPQTNFQIIHDLVDLHMDPQSAVEAPRWSHQPGTPPRDQLPEALRMEEGYERGSRLTACAKKVMQSQWSIVGPSAAPKIIVRDRENGCWMGGGRSAPGRLRTRLLIAVLSA